MPPPPSAVKQAPPPPPAVKQAPPPPPAVKQAPPPPPAVKQAPPPPPAVKQAPPPPPAVKQAPPPPPAVKQAPPPPPAVKQAPPPPPPAVKQAPPPPPPAVKQAPPPPPPAVKQAPPPPPPAVKQAPPPPPAVKQAPPPPPAVKQAPPLLSSGNFLWQPHSPIALQKMLPVNDCGVPSTLQSLVTGSDRPREIFSPLLSMKKGNLGGTKDALNGCVSEQQENRVSMERCMSQVCTVTPAVPEGVECLSMCGKDDDDDTPDSPTVIRENLAHLLRRLNISDDSVAHRPEAAAFTLRKQVSSASHGEEGDDHLDDLFTHLLAVLEKVVSVFLCQSLEKKWNRLISARVQCMSSCSATDAVQLWLLAWRKAGHHDEEAWIEWKSTLCRSWRRTRREYASCERSVALDNALLALYPLDSVYVKSFQDTPCSDGARRCPVERQKESGKLHALVYRLLRTCPALLLDPQTQHLSLVAGIDLNSIREWFFPSEDYCQSESDILEFIRKLSSHEKEQACDKDLMCLDELQRLFAAERCAVLIRMDTGQSPPSSATEALPSSPCSSTAFNTSRSPYPRFYTRDTQHVPSSEMRCANPTPIHLRPPCIASVSWSPGARIPDASRGGVSMHLSSSPEHLARPISCGDGVPSVEKHTCQATRSVGRRRAVWANDHLMGTGASLSPVARDGSTFQPSRRLPSTLRTPRSMSLWW